MVREPMSTNDARTKNAVDVSFTDRISGPHTGVEQYGGTYSYFRCEACGAESVNKQDLRRCCDR
jgi:hypothetical protein